MVTEQRPGMKQVNLSVPTYTVAFNQTNTSDRPITTASASVATTELIGIAPPYRPEALMLEAPAAEEAIQLTYRGGQLLSEVEVITTFWGDGWEQQPQSDILQGISQFFDFILTSELMDQLAEYSVDGQTIGQGQHLGASIVTPSQPFGNEVSDAQLQQLLQDFLAGNPDVPQPTSNRLYFLYLPPSVEVVMTGGDRSCQKFCGYHSSIQGNIFYAVMPFPCEGGCTGGLPILEALTSVSSHELCEAITDAVPGQGWYNDPKGEIGDICAWKQKQVGDYTVQQEWSNQSNACI